MKLHWIVAAGVAAFAFAFVASQPAAAQAPPAPAAPAVPVRHLVYGFTWGTSQNLQVQESGIGTGDAGHANYNSGNNDQGTMTVDVVREQPDKGLVVTIAEQAQGTRKAGPATCVVYGTTAVICDPNKTVNVEEQTLLRFLGANFVDPAIIDSKQHWSFGDTGPGYSMKADYTIAKNDAGVMTIQENRTVKEQQSANTDTSINTTISYDYNRQVPTALNEYTIQRAGGTDGYKTIKSQTTFALQSDSMKPAK
jgi:hypothetical protein